jgi:hypothetical protein
LQELSLTLLEWPASGTRLSQPFEDGRPLRRALQVLEFRFVMGPP